MSICPQDNVCVDVELAVALEVGLTRLERAEQLGGMAEALAYNQDLWRVIGYLASGAAVVRNRDELRVQSLAVAEGRCREFVTINRRFAGLFAAQSAAYGVMSVMLNAWRQHRRSHEKAEFSQWLLDRLDGQICRTQAA
ncbi:hypothetical protein [Magnetospirillum sulfuroxidans]|uniref:Uncharacterized protein n=1 Tax=Magnetospirillum sulfuroxidans TaxID=611300 RepID=A0ABS5I6Y8_9PROT|nr:hypothetical protein [Magnetospirillum sulfuroxidans]MBR9970195.1 hypothetical protein [Magnetospirillum sulfuroxidans]